MLRREAEHEGSTGVQHLQRSHTLEDRNGVAFAPGAASC